jgi:hypothetical protein
MTRCLGERTLWLVREGEGRVDQHAHLRACPRCAARYERLGRDLAAIREALRTPPARAGRPAVRGDVAWRRRLAVAAALALGLGLGGAEAWRWHAAPAPAPAPGLADALPFLADVSAALVAGPENPGPVSSVERLDPLLVMEASSDPEVDGDALFLPETQGEP